MARHSRSSKAITEKTREVRARFNEALRKGMSQAAAAAYANNPDGFYQEKAPTDLDLLEKNPLAVGGVVDAFAHFRVDAPPHPSIVPHAAAVEAAGIDKSAEWVDITPPAQEPTHDDVEIPENWNTGMTWPALKSLASKLTDNPIKNRDDCMAAVQAELDRRAAKAAA